MGLVTLRKIQAGIETTRGTDIAATRKVYAKGLMGREPRFIVPDEDRGTFIGQYRSSLGVVEAGFPLSAGATFEDLAWWFQLGLKGGVTGVLRNVTAYDYMFIPSPSTDDIKSATFEWGDDQQAFEMTFGMVESLEIVGSLDSFWTLAVELIGKDMATTTFTAALGERTVEDVNTYLTKMAIGAAGAEPSSYMVGRFIGFRLRIKNNLRRKYFADGASPSIGGIGRGKRSIELEATFEGNADTITERAAWAAGTSRVVRITAEGTTIAGSSPTTKKTVDLIIPGKWSKFQVGDRETDTVFTGTLMAEYDSALAHDFKAVVTNGLSVLA